MSVKVEINKLLVVAEMLARFGYVRINGESFNVYKFLGDQVVRERWWKQGQVTKRYGLLASVTMQTTHTSAKIKVYGREYLLPLVEKAKEISELCDYDWIVSLESETLGKASIIESSDFHYSVQE